MAPSTAPSPRRSRAIRANSGDLRSPRTRRSWSVVRASQARRRSGSWRAIRSSRSMAGVSSWVIGRCAVRLNGRHGRVTCRDSSPSAGDPPSSGVAGPPACRPRWAAPETGRSSRPEQGAQAHHFRQRRLGRRCRMVLVKPQAPAVPPRSLGSRHWPRRPIGLAAPAGPGADLVFRLRSGVPIRGLSSAGRAPALQAGCRRFDPVRLHHWRRSY